MKNAGNHNVTVGWLLMTAPVVISNPHIRIRAAIINHRQIIYSTSAAALTITAVNRMFTTKFMPQALHVQTRLCHKRLKSATDSIM